MNAQSVDRLRRDWTWPFVCSNCGRSYPTEGLPHLCPVCGGVFDLAAPLEYAPSEVDPKRGSGLVRHRRTFPLPPEAPLPSLGEGDTPLLPLDLDGRTVFFKCEQLNPTGSFKDRGTVVLMAALVAAGVCAAVEDSSGNAGASFAAYAGRAGVRGRVFVPEYASGPKVAQIESYGAEVIHVPGPRSAAAEAARRAAEGGAVYASHAHLPHVLAGMATIAFELVEGLGGPPGAVILPVGQGTLLLGASRGFMALEAAGVIDRLPRMVGVQARACAPIWAVYQSGAAGLEWTREGETQAEGIRIIHPLRGDQVLEAVERSAGWMMAVEEDEIASGRDALSRRGLYVESTSAVVWPALRSAWDELPDPVVVVLTGSGLKSPAETGSGPC